MAQLTESQITRINDRVIAVVKDITGIMQEVAAPPAVPMPTVPWSPESGTWYMSLRGMPLKTQALPESGVALRNAGGCRNDRIDLDRLYSRRMYSERLSALACQLGGEMHWNTKDTCFIYQDSSKIYRVGVKGDVISPEKVYMTQDCAEKICWMIKSGEVVL